MKRKHKGKHQQSEYIADSCIQKILCDSKIGKITTKVDSAIPYLSGLRDLYTSSTERYDVVVYKEMDGGKTKVVQVVEVQSSPMIKTEKKAILGASKLLKFLRHFDHSLSKITVFALPSLKEKS